MSSIAVPPAVLIAVAVVVLLLVLAAAVLVLRGRGRSSLPAGPGGDEAGFVCPFCKRPYDRAQNRRCPACGAATPRG